MKQKYFNIINQDCSQAKREKGFTKVQIQRVIETKQKSSIFKKSILKEALKTLVFHNVLKYEGERFLKFHYQNVILSRSIEKKECFQVKW